MFYTYVLLSKDDGKFYIGFTSDLRKRLAEHQSKKVRSTKGRGDIILIYYEACLDEKDAIKREKYFKQGFGRRFLNNRIEHYLKSSGSRPARHA